MNSKKNIIWNTIGAGTNAFTSLVLSILVTRMNGEDLAGVFTYAFATACLLYVMGVYIGRTYQVTDVENKYCPSDYVYNRILTCGMMIVFAILFVIIKQYDLFKSTIMILLVCYKAVEAFSEVFYAIIQRKNELYKVGISLTIKAIVGIFLFLILNLLTHNLIISICRSITCEYYCVSGI